MTIRKAVLSSALVLALAAGGLAGLAGAPASAAQADVKLVDVTGIVSGSPERVQFYGKARVTSRLAPDPDFNSPTLVLTIDMTPVIGIGAQSFDRYFVPSPEIIQRRVASSHDIIFSFPFLEDSQEGLQARAGKANFSLSFDVNTGEVTAATATVGSLPN